MIENDLIDVKKIIFRPENKNTDIYFNTPALASGFLPEWYRNMSPLVDEDKQPFELAPQNKMINATLKKCTPFVDGMLSGYMIYLKTDIVIQEGPHGHPMPMWRVDEKLLEVHGQEQHPGLPVPSGYDNVVFKWINQWVITTPKKYSLLFTHPINRFDLPFQTFTGLIDCDSYPLAPHFPFFLKKGFRGVIPKGTPIAQILPIVRDSWESEIKEYDEKITLESFQKLHSEVNRSYKNQFWEKKDYK